MSVFRLFPLPEESAIILITGDGDGVAAIADRVRAMDDIDTMEVDEGAMSPLVALDHNTPSSEDGAYFRYRLTTASVPSFDVLLQQVANEIEAGLRASEIDSEVVISG
jgi:hypothetical protein